MNRLAMALSMLVLGLSIPAFAQNQTKTAPPAAKKPQAVASTKAAPSKSTTAAASQKTTAAKTTKTIKKGKAEKPATKQHHKTQARHTGKPVMGKHKATAKTASKSAKAKSTASPSQPTVKKRTVTGSKPMRSTVNRQ